MRTFIGIEFTREIQQQIGDLQSALRCYASAGRWKYSGNLHLTLKFLGEIEEQQTQDIQNCLERVCTLTAPFTLVVDDIGAFSGRRDIRVLWLGLGGELGALLNVQKELENQLNTIGFPTEKRAFTPHITMGQDLSFHCDLSELQRERNRIVFPEIGVEKLHLFNSEQVQNRRVYTSLLSVPFTG